MCACHQSSPLHICISFISFIICNAIATWHTHTQANTLAKYIDTCEHISSASSFLCANASEKSRICVIKKVDRYERCTLHTYRLAQGNRRTAKTAETTKPTANYLCDFCLFVWVREFFCLLHHKFALWLSFCFVLRSVFFYHSTILLLALSSHGFYCLRLLQFTRVLSAYERSIWDAKETRTRMNGVCTRFVHERVCVCVCLSVNELNQNDLT